MASNFNNLYENINSALQDKSKPWTAAFDIVEQKTGVNRVYLALGGIISIVIWLIFGFAGQLLCNIVGFLYPAYVSIRAIESPNKDDDTKWLIYWVVFGFFSLIEFFADIIVGWFPFYWLFKCIFFVWLMMPTSYNGSNMIYLRIIRPYFLKYKNEIDDTINKVKESTSKFTNKNE